MLFLISAGNYLTLFVGWEGEIHCLKWFNCESIYYNIFVPACFIKNKYKFKKLIY
jgi:hypothetical protein